MNIVNLAQNVWTNVRYFWVYASNYGNQWWCYDNNSNGLIEELYTEHITKQQPKPNDGSSSFAAQLYDSDDEDDTPSEVKIGNSTYVIDFDTMFQKSKITPTKRRKIKRIDVGDGLLFDEKMDKLENTYHVLGIGGIKF